MADEKISTLIRRGAERAGFHKIQGSFIDVGPVEDDYSTACIRGVCGNGAAGLGALVDFDLSRGYLAIMHDVVNGSPASKVEIPQEIKDWVHQTRVEAGWVGADDPVKWDHYNLYTMIVVLNDLSNMTLLEIADFVEALGY